MPKKIEIGLRRVDTRDASDLTDSVEHSLVIGNDEPHVRPSWFLAEACVFEHGGIGVRSDEERHEPEPGELRLKPSRGQPGRGMAQLAGLEDLRELTQYVLTAGRGDVTSQDRVLLEGVELG